MSAETSVVRVAVPVPLTEALDYHWTGPAPPPPPGCRVRVPLGRKDQIGVVISHPRESDVKPMKLRNVLETLDREPVLGKELLETLSWCAQYYHHPIGEVMSQALPSLLRRGRSAVREPAQAWGLTDEGRAQDIAAVSRRAPSQARALEWLSSTGTGDSRELREAGIGRDALQRLIGKGWIQLCEAPSNQEASAGALEPALDLTPEQRRSVDSIHEAPAGYRAYLLHGVTGSGKTEVYMQLIAEHLAEGRQSLLLVPEIGLTPQLVARLMRRFGHCLAIMHSGLTPGERLDAWLSARAGTAKVIVGTRSAIFAPLADAGLIIVDEEHDASYKQQDGFRYSARDLAVVRARRLKIPVLLASATPSLESFYNGERGRYWKLTMKQRIGSAGDPKIRIIDMNRHAARHGLSTPLVTSIEQHLSEDHQVLLFLNRRGFAPVLLCTQCGTVEECQRCDARMTIHASRGELRCHHCGQARPLSWACGTCGSERIAVGAGTQRVTEDLAALFPDARIARLDRDTTAHKGNLETVLAGVADGDIQILVGTQMLTKGHDFPGVTLVGVLSADQGLFGTDFRSSERLAQTFLQVAGRAGRRDAPGEVLIQSHYPEHPLLACLTERDYTAFAELALAERKTAGWPPFSHLIVWRAEAQQRGPAYAFLHKAAAAARAASTKVVVLGPAAPSMERRGGRFRAQLLFQCDSRTPLHELMRKLRPIAQSWPESRRVRWGIDVDPTEL